jgi:type II secretory pathway predicted ATPase ExeA
LNEKREGKTRSPLFTLLCGDQRLPERFRTPELLPLGSRIRARLPLGPLAPEELQAYLTFSLEQAGAPQLCTPELVQALVTHAAGNFRLLTGI